jgi:signal transduction histidine kinase
MLQSMVKIIRQLLHLGNTPNTPFVVYYQNLMFNLFFLFATPFVLLVFVVNLLTAEYVLAGFSFLQLIIFSFCFWISATQKHLFLRAYFLLLNAIIGIIAAYIFKNGSEYRLLIMMVAAVVIFDKKWQYIFFVLLLSVSFVAIRLNDMMLASMHWIDLLQIITKILLPLIFFGACLYYFKQLYFENQYKLEQAYRHLSDSKNEKERILNVVAHDLRTPISGISGITKLMLQDTAISTEHKELLSLIEDASASSLKMIKELLSTNINTMEKSKFKNVEANKYFAQAIKLLAFSSQEKRIQLHTNYLDYPVYINIDTDLIDRVIANLINNAIKFSVPHSNIYISLAINDSTFTFTIKDEGIGIATEDQERIFDMFTAAKRKGTAGEKSFGLGLSICKQIIELHNGTIHVTSELGKGTSFLVKLPVSS